ncbi:nuclease-related domain-containing protein [Neobacillus niacini]|uniref:nuclease-related domain-containing protein n=1 Tax=Neobacillus niacini TaxID=86668 RepID=UPI002FFEBE18
MKERSDSLTLKGLIAAQGRLPANHTMQSTLSAKQASIEAGIGGEERVAEVLRSYTFPLKNHIFHDLSLASDSTFQIDHFIQTPNFGVLLETKNISGSLEFKDHPPQLIQTKDNGQINSYESPVTQLERNTELLSLWLAARNIQLPLFGAVVLAYPKQIVAVPPSDTTILFPNMIPPFIKGLPQEGKKLDSSTFKRLSSQLLSSHRPYVPKPISESYQIPFNDFQPGVRCTTCGKLGMIKHKRTWHCKFCDRNDSMAHVKELQEWFLIFKRSITNRECREWLQVEDKYTANRILQSMNFRSEGTFRDRKYFIDFRKGMQPRDIKSTSHI